MSNAYSDADQQARSSKGDDATVSTADTGANTDANTDTDTCAGSASSSPHASPLPPKISVIIPVLNEARYLPDTIRAIRRDADEAIVVDGGSDDGSMQVAAELGVDRVVQTMAGRANQLNYGAGVAEGDIFVFLHADTLLSPNALNEVRLVMENSCAVGGAFRLRIASARRLVRWVAPMVNLRTRLLRLPYGDQGIFIRRHAFEMMSGFQALPIMEDVDLVQRMRKRGRLVLLRSTATTAARRWEANGVLRTTLINWVAALAFRVGVPPGRISSFYDRQLRPRLAEVQSPPTPAHRRSQSV